MGVMIHALCLLIGLQLAGTALAELVGLPIPGPVLGLMFLLVWLVAGGRRPAGLDAAADGFIRYLPLLFVPAAVGLVQYLDLLSEKGGWLFVVVVLSTLAGLLVSVVVFSAVAARASPPDSTERR